MKAAHVSSTVTQDGLLLEFPAPSHPMSANVANKGHWAVVRNALKPWQAWATLAAGKTQDWAPVPVNIRVDIPFREARVRDPHNYTSTVVKAVVDGVKAGRIIPDDNPEWATILEPHLVIQPDKSRPLMVAVHITPRSLP